MLFEVKTNLTDFQCENKILKLFLELFLKRTQCNRNIYDVTLGSETGQKCNGNVYDVTLGLETRVSLG